MLHHIVGREDVENGETGDEWSKEAALYALR